MSADAVLPLAVATPLAVAALLMSAARGRLERIAAPTATLTAVAVAGALAWAASHGPVVHWFGGWRPVGAIVPGVPFVAGPLSGPLAALVAVVVGVSLLYSSRYFDEVTPAYQVLMLTFLAGMVGFVLTGDGFNLFVFYELVGVSAYALTGYIIRHEGPLQGAINFAVSNTIGSLLLLTGIVFIYVATGTPNLAAAGEAVGEGPIDGAIIAAYVLVAVGCFVKAAIVPFHFWHADAHAVAPTPVCAVFAGVMIQLGIYAFARLNWVVFHPLWEGQQDAVRGLLVTVAAVTALLAATMTVLQSHLKRMLAFSSVAHTGVAFLGVATLTSTGVAGAAIYISAHAAVKAALFLAVGIVLHRLGDVEEHHLHGRGRRLGATGAAMTVGALALAGLPPFGLSIGKELIEQAAGHHGLGWLAITVVVLVGGLTGGAVLRASARIFRGWGRPSPGAETAKTGDGGDRGGGEERETEGGYDRTPALMLGPVALLLVAALLAGAVPGFTAAAESAAHWFTEPSRYASLVLDGHPTVAPPVPTTWFTVKGLLTAAAAVIAALVTAYLGVRGPVRAQRGGRAPAALVRRLHAVHSGHVGDYVAWLVAGLAALGAAARILLP